MKRANVRMIQGGEGAPLLVEPRRVQALELLDRDDPIKPRVTCLVHLTHAARANGRKDFVRSELIAWLKRHLGVRAKFIRSRGHLRLSHAPHGEWCAFVDLGTSL